MASHHIINRIKYKWSIYKHWGFRYQCPLCGFHCSEWQPCGSHSEVYTAYQTVGAGYRNARCWKCGSRERERMLYLYLRDIIHIKDPNTHLHILHIAPELNIAARLSQLSNIDYVCGDLFTDGYDYPDYVQNMNVLDLPFIDHIFDMVICNHVLEHIPDDIRALSQLYRVLKPGGKAILQVPLAVKLDKTIEDSSVTTREDREKTFGQYDHVRLYGMDYFDRLRSVGFEVHPLDIASHYPQYGLNQAEQLILCEKY